jgi:putative ABC transport system permease protein
MFTHYLDLAWRSFKRTPLVSGLMVLAVAVGIGITMTSLSVYHMMSADPIPLKSERLFHPQINTRDDGEAWWTSDEHAHQMTYKDAINLYRAPLDVKKTPMIRTGFTLHMDSSEVKPFRESVRMAGRDFFTMFNQDFIYGGPWTMSQELNALPLAVIDETLNEKLFGGENSVGESFMLNDTQFQIVGVTKECDINIKFYDLNNGAFNKPERIFIPFSLMETMEIDSWGNTNGWKYEVIDNYQGFLQSEMNWVQFWIELNTAEQQQAFREYLVDYLTEQGTLGRFTREEVAYELRNVKEWMTYNEVVSEDNQVLVALSFMFLIVCLANILGLLLGKFLRRAPEVGVRRALGANKKHIFMQHLVEVALLGFMGGLLGILIAQLGLWGVRQTYGYYSSIATMDLSMLLAAPAIAIVACIIAGLYPAWLVCRTTPAIYLKTQ